MRVQIVNPDQMGLNNIKKMEENHVLFRAHSRVAQDPHLALCDGELKG